ncbi:hypothetical protein [Streptomyces sp. NPDC059994]|uniref:hypothetical protein n=1 Tax=Streptomyces sp. NPDC059994 TaxID=3347029 RepID=UPI00368AF653
MKASYTPAEKRERAWLLLRTSKQAVADAVDPRLVKRLDRIEQQAAERGQREYESLHRRLEVAKDTAADARAAERTAPRADKGAARHATREANKQVARIENELHRHCR